MTRWPAPGVEQGQPARLLEERVRFMRDGLLNISGFLVSALVSILLVPVLLKGLGEDSYGLWIAALAVVALVAVLDFGLSWSLTRVVASGGGLTPSSETLKFVAGVRAAYLLIGVVGGLGVFLVGVVLTPFLKLSPPAQQLAPWLFGLLGASLVADQLAAFVLAVFHGLRRFDAANAIVIVSAVVRGLGVILVLRLGGGLWGLAVWQAGVSAATLVGSIVLLRRCAPVYLRLQERPAWGSLRPHLEFSVFSQLNAVVSAVLWHSTPLLIGLVRGPSPIVPYHIGQKFPLGVSWLNWHSAQVAFPAASELAGREDRKGMADLLIVATRWPVVLSLPLCLLFVISAPYLLQVWIGQASQEMVTVLRLLAGTVFVEAIGVGSFYLLWGAGKARSAFVIWCSAALIHVGLTLWLLPRLGVVGAAWSMLVAMSLATWLLLALVTVLHRLSFLQFITGVFRGLAVPALAGVGMAAGLGHVLRPDGWIELGMVAIGGGLAYATVFYFWGSREEERHLFWEILYLPQLVMTALGPRLVGLLRRIRPLRNAYHFFRCFQEMVWNPWGNPKAFLSAFESEEDPWHFLVRPEEEGRHLRALQMLDAARNGTRFHSGLEVGCAEGVFTRHLAQRCEEVFAVDVSPLALSRAAERCRQLPNVRFRQWDFLCDPPVGTFELVIVMGLLECFFRPRDLRAARDKVVDMIQPNGFVLVTVSKAGEVVEQARWGRWFLRGARWIDGFLREHPQLRLVETTSESFYIASLYQKVG